MAVARRRRCGLLLLREREHVEERLHAVELEERVEPAAIVRRQSVQRAQQLEERLRLDLAAQSLHVLQDTADDCTLLLGAGGRAAPAAIATGGGIGRGGAAGAAYVLRAVWAAHA